MAGETRNSITVAASPDVVQAVKWAIEGVALDYANRARATSYKDAHDFYRDCQGALKGIADLVEQAPPSTDAVRVERHPTNA